MNRSFTQDESVCMQLVDFNQVSVTAAVDLACHALELLSCQTDLLLTLPAPVCVHFCVSDLRRAQLGLAHSYSRAKVKFNVNKVDNMVIQAIALLDTLDKDINTFIMRVREWYSWHFPELVKVRNRQQE